MTRPRVLIGIMTLIMSGTGAAITPICARAQEQTPSTAPATDTPPVTKPGRMDPKHPLHIGSDHYPKQSLKNHEQGACYMSFLINTDGSVPAAQLLKSSGYPRLDTACIESIIGVPMLPGTVNEMPITGWFDFPVVWLLNPPHLTRHPPLEKSAVPRIADGYELLAGKEFNPDSTRSGHPKGYCVVHAVVDTTGKVRDARVTSSTVSSMLDRLCVTTIARARFTPELQNGLAVEDATDVAIYW